jgi:PAS domain-containing protein
MGMSTPDLVQAAPSRAARILHIEPDHGEAVMLASVLRVMHPGAFELVGADALGPGLNRLAEGDIECVLIELASSEGGGLAGIEVLIRAAPSVPVVVLTAADDPALGLGAVRAGAQDFLVKGADGGAVGRALLYAMERHQAEREGRERARLDAAALRALREGVAVLDADGRVITLNPAAAGMLGRAPGDAAGHPLLAPADGPVDADERPLDLAEPPFVAGLGRAELVVGVTRGHGDRVWLSMSARRLEAGEALRRTVVSLVDLTECRRQGARCATSPTTTG